MRTNLIQARKDKGWTQKQVSEYLRVGERHYKKIEKGETLGSVPLWDDLEDLFGVNQRVLRENHPDTADSPSKRPECPQFEPDHQA